MSNAATKSRKPKVPETTTPVKSAAGLRISQLALDVVLLDEYDAPVPAPGGPVVFCNTADGTAAQHLIAWVMQNLPIPATPDAQPAEPAAA